ncbi:hypothetical protein DA792_07715 [Celeribacter baekdonensis]|uniref:Uncharacterized protein n=1 Tax=Celeribacter baekdonensis TaxID=875171 RepID=A0A2R4M1D9_9RHOB|nr:hypothetical protein DA792_07715 [Celeribacter baekdonensis]
MALTFGDSVPSVSSAGPSRNLSYGTANSGFSVTDWLFGSSSSGPGYSSGVPIVGTSGEYVDALAAAGVNTTQMDGTTGFASALSGLASAVLGSMGAQDDTPQYTQVSAGKQVAGFDVRTIAIFGVIGAAIYYLAKK